MNTFGERLTPEAQELRAENARASASHKPYTTVWPPDEQHEADPAYEPGYKHASELVTHPTEDTEAEIASRKAQAESEKS
jgi:hypothetical protein